MHSKIENNTILDETNCDHQSDYVYNFFDTPWDDRSRRSKILIAGLLCAIFIATFAVITHNLIVFYTGFERLPLVSSDEINCNVVKVDKYPYAARIHSTATQELVCVGAMVSASSVLISAVCLKSGPIRLYLGSFSNHHCKKGFSVEVTELIRHDGVITKNLALLKTRENILECGNIVHVGLNANDKLPVFVIGRPFRGGRSLSFQPATIAPTDNNTNAVGVSIDNFNKENFICVKYLPKCPVWAGDLLVQGDRLIGIASTSAQRGENNDLACFANLSIVHAALKELDADVEFDVLL